MTLKVQRNAPKFDPIEVEAAVQGIRRLAQRVQSVLHTGKTPDPIIVEQLRNAVVLTKVAADQEKKLSLWTRVCLYFSRCFSRQADPEAEYQLGYNTVMPLLVARHTKAERALKAVLDGKKEIEKRMGHPVQGVSDKDLEAAVEYAHHLNNTTAAPEKGRWLRPKDTGLKRTLYRDKTGIYLVYNQGKQKDELAGKGGIKDVKYGHELLSGRTIARQTIKFEQNFNQNAVATDDVKQLRNYANEQGQVEVLSFSEKFTSESKKKKGLHVEKVHVYMPLYEGTLDGFREKNLDRRQKLNVLLQMAQSVAFLHDQGKGHGDIKPANFLVDKDLNVCLNDYGTVFDPKRDKGWTFGTQIFMPSEYRNNSNKPRKLDFDIYSLGVTFCQMLYKDPQALNNDKGSFENELLISMTQQQAGMRPSINQVIRWLEQEYALA